jgi:hypothetical protein
MDVKELLDEDAFDPKKLFNQEEYSTLIIGREGFTKKENHAADLIETLLDKKTTREESEAIFSSLKELKANKLLIQAIKEAARIDERSKLTAACWESGLDFSDELLFFAGLVCQDNFSLAMEALTVVENMEGSIETEVLIKALQVAESCKVAPQGILQELIENLKSRTI